MTRRTALIGSSGRQSGPTPPGPDPDPGWPDDFMSYPNQATPIVINGQNGTAQNPIIVEERSFESIYRATGQPIQIINSSHVTVRRIDSRNCSMGILYAVDSTDIILEWCRAENIAKEFDYAPWAGNQNDMNFAQFNRCARVTVQDCKGRYGCTEDVFSFFDTSDVLAQRLAWEGATLGTEPTSDASPAVRWRSASGTGILIGDGGSATNCTVKDSSFLNPGQVGFAVAGGTTMTYDNVITLSERASTVSEFDEKPSGENIASYVSNFYAPNPCDGADIFNCRTDFSNGDNFFDSGSCTDVDTTGTVFGDGTLDPEDYRVTL